MRDFHWTGFYIKWLLIDLGIVLSELKTPWSPFKQPTYGPDRPRPPSNMYISLARIE